MDWIALIQDLIDHGWSQARIAKECDTGQSHVSGLYRGERKCPNWELGQKLIALHRKLCPSSQPRKPKQKEAA